MMISALRIQKKVLSRLNVYVDGEFAFSISREIALRERVRAGLEVSASALDHLRRLDEIWRARERALSLLERRARSTNELRAKLAQRKFSPEAIAECVTALLASGLLNDEEYARAFVLERLRTRPKAAPALIGELRSRGIDRETAARVVTEVLGADTSDEADLAKRVLRKFRQRAAEPALAVRRRAYGFLARRGFSAETIARVIDEAGIGTDE